MDGTVTALNSSTQTTINAVALSELEQIDGADGDGVKGDGNYAFMGTGKAWVNGVTTAIAVRISFNKANNLTRVAITSPDGAEFYAGGTAVGVRFTVTPDPPIAPTDDRRLPIVLRVALEEFDDAQHVVHALQWLDPIGEFVADRGMSDVFDRAVPIA